MRHLVLTLSVTTFSALPLAAQWQFAELPRAYLPAIAELARVVSAGDVDGDGDLDLAVGTDGQCRLLLGDGNGSFTDATAGRLPQLLQNCNDLVLFDGDGDGDLDLYCANNQQDRLYRNNGSGTFTDVTATALPVDTTNDVRVVAVDLDGDGDRDLVTCQAGPFPLRIWRNQGGVFVNGSAQALAGISGWTAGRVVAADLDGDGDQDLVATGVTNHLLENLGNGVFADVSGRLPANYTFCTSVAALDVDGDNDLDLVFGCTGQDRLCINDGNGVFTDATALLPADNDATAAVAAFDADGDGDADLLFANRGPDRFYRNDQGTFSDQSANVPQHRDAGRLVIADVDQDNDLDVCLAGEVDAFAWVQTLQLWLNAGNGVFHDGTARPLPAAEGYAPALADLDGDGDLDCFLGTAVNKPNLLFRNDGTGNFTEVTAGQLPANTDRVRAAAFGDVDGDGDADLLLACLGPARLWRNDGSGTFTDVSATHLPPGLVDSEALVLVDVDGDGDRDVVTTASGQHRLLRNTNGVFVDVTATQTPAPATTLATTSVAAGDVDGDGDLDLAFTFASYGQQALWLNDGAGTFTDVTALRLPTSGGGSVRAVALADIDGDLDLDLVTGATGQNRLYINNGSGWFLDDTLLRLPPDNDDTSAVVPGDVDGDGDIDLVFGNVYSPLQQQIGRDRLYINDGTGHFLDETLLRLAPTPLGSRALALGDADGDGDLDLFGGPGLFTNRAHQLHAPFLLRPGRPWQLDAYARFAAPGSTDVALPWLSLTRTSIPVPPFGTLGIVPQAPLPMLVIPQPAGVGSVTWMAPNTPTLVGVTLHAQALWLSSLGRVRLSNVVSDTFVN